MDISDVNFKPCPCGYQICRFCWHHIKENLNGRCPACRREYTDDAVQFKPINKEDHKRLTQQKKQRERERKELDALGRRHLANVRVVQRNVVYVVGIGPRFAKEELIPTLRSHEYFGQYGKISKIVIVKRTSPGGRAPVVGLYITFHRREDAARCIAAVDGAPSPGASGEVMRASYGTTKYCMTFLRGASCPDHSCMSLHEWGDENDCFTKEDLTTLKHTMKDTESRARTITIVKKGEDAEGLPRAASWANKPPTTVANTALQNHTNAMQSVAARQQRRIGSTSAASTTTPATRQQKISSIANNASISSTKKAVAAKSPSLASFSRPATPVLPGITASIKASKQKDTPSTTAAAARPASPATAEPESKPSPEEPSRASSPPGSEPLSPEPTSALPTAPPGLPTLPPGLSAPPGLPPPSHTPISTDSSPQIPMQMPQGPYQMSTAAQALIEDLRARRENTLVVNVPNPFPEFDRMMQSLAGDNSFSFSLDPKLAADTEDVALPDFQTEGAKPFGGSFFDAFPGVRQPPPPGLGFPQLGGSRDRIGTPSSSYSGSFNPFGNDLAEEPSQQYPPLDEERKVSRFGFARGRQGSAASTSASSPLHASASLNHSESFSQAAYFAHSEVMSPPLAHPSPSQWSYTSRHHDYLNQSASAMSSPLAQHAQAHHPYEQAARYQQGFDTSVSEAQLRDFINSSRDRAARTATVDPNSFKFSGSQSFSDPAIMSARLASPAVAQPIHESGYANVQPPMESYQQQQQQLAYGPPPGLAYPPGIMPGPTMRHGLGLGAVPSAVELAQAGGSAHALYTVPASPSPVIPSPVLSSSDFPALSAPESTPNIDQQQPADSSEPTTPLTETKAQSRAERAAAKKKAAAEVSATKAAAKAAEKERLASQKAAKEKAAALQKAAEREKAAREKAEREEKERLEREKAERVAERATAAKAEREKVEVEKAEKEKMEKERVEKEKVEKAGAAKAAAKTGKLAEAESISQTSMPAQASKPPSRRDTNAKQPSTPVLSSAVPVVQAPILARLPKKTKPNAKPIKIPKEDSLNDVSSAIASATASEAPQLPEVRNESSSSSSRAHSEDRTHSEPRSLEEFLAEIDVQVPWIRLARHPFFDITKINPASKLPLEYGPLVHALSALSVGGGSFANTMPSGSIDNAVSSFQQLLETLTQTISDLLRLLPRTTWDDSSSFDGVLRDMLKGDDFLEDGGEEPAPQGKEDEVAALTMALERRARWMEVQLSKLEELHRDINNAAVRAVLTFNDNGWDLHGFMPRMGDTLTRFENLGKVFEGKVARDMTADELERELALAKESVAHAETELRDMMQSLQVVKPSDEDV
ncbi:uncharacterized protein PHACADRAFT_122027 [Phanerochaete carnosa HHB-10118-sp]|uniref:RRM domain-containing protein n=1 Tax=Phanerochaete carnosa (strain HHB-10118-sp) TaxID=650164 RepID=K5WZN1_PHACS|nr:uncharacterized protein PHACADRAFT_122027 [Phanerochaete carnosa HHB-10118-sp]EKM55967.1 hypothetical protein PHACADRAFT_122027 [Phanerochaete carnosa HHB-10118-sp]